MIPAVEPMGARIAPTAISLVAVTFIASTEQVSAFGNARTRDSNIPNSTRPPSRAGIEGG